MVLAPLALAPIGTTIVTPVEPIIKANALRIATLVLLPADLLLLVIATTIISRWLWFLITFAFVVDQKSFLGTPILLLPIVTFILVGWIIDTLAIFIATFVDLPTFLFIIGRARWGVFVSSAPAFTFIVELFTLFPAVEFLPQVATVPIESSVLESIPGYEVVVGTDGSGSDKGDSNQSEEAE